MKPGESKTAARGAPLYSILYQKIARLKEIVATLQREKELVELELNIANEENKQLQLELQIAELGRPILVRQNGIEKTNPTRFIVSNDD